MAFKAGQSGNPGGRARGVPNKRTQLAKLFDIHAPALINKAVALALDGDVQAIKLCLDKIIPRAEHTPLDITLPDEINPTNLPEVKSRILVAVLDGKMSVTDAERLVALISNQVGTASTPYPPLPIMPTDPTEAANVYRRFMQDS
jgi:hypothetical protein